VSRTKNAGRLAIPYLVSIDIRINKEFRNVATISIGVVIELLFFLPIPVIMPRFKIFIRNPDFLLEFVATVQFD